MKQSKTCLCTIKKKLSKFISTASFYISLVAMVCAIASPMKSTVLNKYFICIISSSNYTCNENIFSVRFHRIPVHKLDVLSLHQSEHPSLLRNYDQDGNQSSQIQNHFGLYMLRHQLYTLMYVQ